MFPLGSVLLPGMVLPLHVFEPRYRALVDRCLAGDREFGVVLIERGREVGGGDVRTSIGTVARIAEAGQFPDGRWALAAVGVRRLRVEAWLPDDPYPLAEVVDWPDDEPARGDELAEEAAAAAGALRRLLALAAEVGERVPAVASLELPDDAAALAWAVAALAPIGPVDRHLVLAASGPAERLSLLRRLLAEQEEVLQFRLDAGPEDDDGAGDLGGGPDA
jgi:Lon protease-like protein